MTSFFPRPDGSKVAVVPERILFTFDSAVLRAEGRHALAELVPEIRDHQGSVDVIGYTDGVGTAEYNSLLSQRRAAAVAAYLERLGVRSSVINVEGRGEAGATDGVRDSTRRRVEIILSAAS